MHIYIYICNSEGDTLRGQQPNCPGVYVTQVYFYANVHICEHTRCRLCTYVYMYICVCVHAYAYGYVCVSMILLDTLRCCCWDFLSVHTCAYACVCVCVYMYVCIVHVYMYVYVYMYVCVYVCIYIYIRAHVGVHVYSCRRILFICTVQSLYYMRVYPAFLAKIWETMDTPAINVAASQSRQRPAPKANSLLEGASASESDFA